MAKSLMAKSFPVFDIVIGNGDSSTKSITALIVEDDDNLREFFHQLLRPHVKVLAAGTIREALQVIDQADILFLDWRLGHSSGEVILDAWVERGKGPLCVCSGSTPPEMMAALFAKGAYNVLAKPVQPDVLLGVLRHFIKDVATDKELAKLKHDIKWLRRYVILVTIALASFQGITGLPELVKFLSEVF